MRVSAQPNINSKQYLDAPIIVPDMDTQKQIIKYAEKISVKKESLQKESKELKYMAVKKFNHLIFG